jgi:hypothetical protein
MTFPAVMPDRTFAGLDVASLISNWVRRNNAEVRQGNHYSPVATIARALNHLLAYHPRINVSWQWPFTKRPQPTGSLRTDIMRWQINDEVVNARSRTFRMLAIPRASDPYHLPSDAVFQRLDSALSPDANTIGPSSVSVQTTPAPAITDISPQSMRFSRGAATGTVDDEGLASYNSQSLVGLVVQDDPIEVLNTSTDFVAPGLHKTGDEILGNEIVEAIRKKLHEVRSKNLPVLGQYYAWKDGANYATTTITIPGGTNGAGNFLGIRINATTLLNVLDFASTSRSAVTPGILCHQRYCGQGSTALANGKKLRVICWVLANATASDSTVRFIGPDTWASNQTDVSVPTAGGLAWYGGASNDIYIDTSVAVDDATTKMAKIDVLGKTGGSGDLYIYGIMALAAYGL